MEQKNLLFVYIGLIFLGIFCYATYLVSLKEAAYPPIEVIVKYRNFLHEDPKRFIPLSKKFGLQCERLLDKDVKYMDQMKKKRIVYADAQDLKTDCDSIKSRAYFGAVPATIEEKTFPIAYAKIVYKDYLFLEQELAAEYAPQNFYCFSLDNKSSILFKKRMRSLAKCLPNVIVSDQEFDMDSTGHNHNYAYMKCFEYLLRYQWKYIVLMQNYDVMLRTNSELVQIFGWFNGANDISTYDMQHYMYRIDSSYNWTYENLGLIKNPLLQKEVFNKPHDFKFAKSLIESSLSREFIEFIFNDLNITTFMEKLQYKRSVSPEESMVATLNAADVLKAPGGFTHYCLDKHKTENGAISRHTLWGWDVPPPGCDSKHIRHGICIYGVESLHKFESYPNIMVNKMLPDFDFGAIMCWHERFFNKIHLSSQSKYKINPAFYLNLPHVRYHNEKKKNGTVILEKFDCKFNGSILPILVA